MNLEELKTRLKPYWKEGIGSGVLVIWLLVDPLAAFLGSILCSAAWFLGYLKAKEECQDEST